MTIKQHTIRRQSPHKQLPLIVLMRRNLQLINPLDAAAVIPKFQPGEVFDQSILRLFILWEIRVGVHASLGIGCFGYYEGWCHRLPMGVSFGGSEDRKLWGRIVLKAERAREYDVRRRDKRSTVRVQFLWLQVLQRRRLLQIDRLEVSWKLEVWSQIPRPPGPQAESFLVLSMTIALRLMVDTIFVVRLYLAL